MQGSKNDSFYRPVEQSAFIFLCLFLVGGACAAIYFLHLLWITLLIGVGLGVILRPAVEWMKSKGKVADQLAIPVVFLALLTLMGGLIGLIYVVISEQVIPLSKKMPEYLSSIQSRLSSLSEHYHFIPNHIGSQNLGANFGNAAQAAVTALTSSAALAGNLVFIVAVCLYFCSDPKGYTEGFLSLFPKRNRRRTAEVMSKCADAVRKWFTSQIIAMLIMGAVLALALAIVGHEYWYLLGILTAFLEMIPFIGPLVAIVLGGVITLAAQPEKLIPVLAIYFVLIQLEGNLLIPLLMKGRIKIPPIHLLTTMFIFSEWFGLPGLLIATPVLAIGCVVYNEVYLPWVNKMTPAKSS